MHKARAFFFVCAGIFLLALAYHLGAQSARAQAGAEIAGYAASSVDGHQWVVTSTGDVYHQCTGQASYPLSGPPTYLGNFWTGAPTPAQGTSWGQLKAKYATPEGKAGQVNGDR